jgi:hypothetical protein
MYQNVIAMGVAAVMFTEREGKETSMMKATQHCTANISHIPSDDDLIVGSFFCGAVTFMWVRLHIGAWIVFWPCRIG